jgi:DNA-binding GntR family transcriptional regulator
MRASVSKQHNATQGLEPDDAERYRAIGALFTGDRARVRSRELAYETVKAAILAGMLEPRERLVEEKLGAALQLSRTPIREALAILEHEDIIESVPYKGLMVRTITVEEFLSMYEALGHIEAAVARAAVPNVTASDIERLSSTLDLAESLIPHDVPGHLAACREFQRQLCACSNNPFLTKLLLGIEERSDMYLIHSRQELPAEKMHASVSDRRKILNAVREGDEDAAARASHDHARAIRERWREMYPEPMR